MNLLNNAEFVAVENAAAAGQTTLTTDVIDLAGWSGVVFIAKLGDVTSGSVLGFAAHSSDDDDTGFDDLENPIAFTAGASDADNKLLILDVAHSHQRYVRAVLTRGTANCVLDSIIAIKYGPLSVPVTQGATVLASRTLANAAYA